MSSYNPPNEKLPIYNDINFSNSNDNTISTYSTLTANQINTNNLKIINGAVKNYKLISIL